MSAGRFDGPRLNLASEVARHASELQSLVSNRRSKAKDQTLVAALDSIEAGVEGLAAAVVILATGEPADDD